MRASYVTAALPALGLLGDALYSQAAFLSSPHYFDTPPPLYWNDPKRFADGSVSSVSRRSNAASRVSDPVVTQLYNQLVETAPVAIRTAQQDEVRIPNLLNQDPVTLGLRLAPRDKVYVGPGSSSTASVKKHRDGSVDRFLTISQHLVRDSHDHSTLAATLAHEMAHHVCDHGLHKMAARTTNAHVRKTLNTLTVSGQNLLEFMMGWWMLFKTLSIAIEPKCPPSSATFSHRLVHGALGAVRSPAVACVAFLGFSVGMGMWLLVDVLALSRKQELEADRMGLLFLAAAGWHPVYMADWLLQSWARVVPRRSGVSKIINTAKKSEENASSSSNTRDVESTIRARTNLLEAVSAACRSYDATAVSQGTHPLRHDRVQAVLEDTVQAVARRLFVDSPWHVRRSPQRKQQVLDEGDALFHETQALLDIGRRSQAEMAERWFTKRGLGSPFVSVEGGGGGGRGGRGEGPKSPHKKMNNNLNLETVQRLQHEFQQLREQFKRVHRSLDHLKIEVDKKPLTKKKS